jgi:hypothetical protein
LNAIADRGRAADLKIQNIYADDTEIYADDIKIYAIPRIPILFTNHGVAGRYWKESRAAEARISQNRGELMPRRLKLPLVLQPAAW